MRVLETQPTIPVASEEAPAAPAERKAGGGLVASFGHALDGLLDSLDRGRNMKLHLVSGILVGMVGSGIPLRISERLALLVCVGLVIAAEAFNTAIEAAIDLTVDGFHEKARIAKDAAAGAVLALSIASALVLAAIVLAEAATISRESSRVLRQAAVGVPIAACAACLLARFERPLVLDLLLAAVGLVGLGLVATWTASAPFTGLALLLFGASAGVAVRRRMAMRGLPSAYPEAPPPG